mmetsp:Transcript_125268/g.243842  ORF Transcript_125268/g.243842 Transcript_125268/m.243842 type:complete len:317 (-) Transcript_125268:52-1002(-)
MSAMELQGPPCSRFAASCYQASKSWQQWNRPQQLPGTLASDGDDDARHRSLLDSIGAPPGLELLGPESLFLDAPTGPITPPPLPYPCKVTPSRKFVEAAAVSAAADVRPLFIQPTFTNSCGNNNCYINNSAIGNGRYEQFPPKFNLPSKLDVEIGLAAADTDSVETDGGELFLHRQFDSSSEEAASAAGQTPEESPSWFSKGSLKHDKGKCTPCHFFQRKQGCTSGAKCRFCHLHEDMRDRPDKRKRDKARRAVDEWQQKDCDAQTKREMAAKLAEKDAYTKMLLERRLRDMDDEAHASFQQVASGGMDHFAQFPR